MDDYEGNGLAAFNDARSRGWSGSVTLADLEKLSAGNPIMHGIAAVWPDAPPSRQDQAYQTSIDRWKQLGKDAFFAPANGLKAFMDEPTFNNALGVMPMGGIGKMPIRPPTGIRAYHVSPYDFDRFRMDKIGTGEGAQAYGHGLYFAENPKVSGGPGSQYWRDFADTGKFPNVGDPATDTAVRMLQTVKGDTASAIARLESLQSRLKDRNPGLDGAIELLKSGKPVGPVSYEVNINAKPEQFLDWDRPLGQQPVFDAIRESKDIFGRLPWDRGRAASPTPGSTGRDAYDAIASNIRRGAAESGKPIDPHLSYPMASDALRGAGIPGIRYLDQGSRGQGAGTSNYVLFNDKIVDIMKKWSLAGAIPFAAASDYDGRF